MIHGKTDLKPFRKLSYREFDCNWESNQNKMNLTSHPPLGLLIIIIRNHISFYLGLVAIVIMLFNSSCLKIDEFFSHSFRCVALWMYALELQQNHLEPLNTMTQSSLYSFAELFSFMISEHQEREKAQGARAGYVSPLTIFLSAAAIKVAGVYMASRIHVLSFWNLCVIDRVVPSPGGPLTLSREI
jgi:hypothetical protein